ncbi:glycosyltransferase family 4 protein [Staphylococcus lugdunensis]|jgi:glycosyltransferase involved in cell wall biosynthesis|uniref:glycosyltransferase family 4 protein n=1 Tax=Staphylococcus lugdunensis TaxID=28035 RepID=UPI00045B02B2|nr:glycosyltransferase family 4 protein [Staphylococcus lugdunensis]KAK56045.1 glycosyltransferase, group 1 family protein [Staphylococcus lugdunensis VCU150]MCI2845195.1 glycosyltransferase family 4 protein [Staphylococcus lugdunensis]MDU4768844.1 glycosyltransferase family 4 protein [Staphylococcus lugdunensis]
MKSFTFLMHNIYALGGTVKAVSQLANTLAERGHDVTIVSVLRAADTPYFALNNNIKVIDLVDYRLKPQNISGIIANRIRKFTPLLKPKKISKYEPGLSQLSSFIEKKIIASIKQTATDVLVGTRASYNILVAQFAPKNVFTIGMEHMNFDAHPTRYQHQIIRAYQGLDAVTTLTDSDQFAYQQRIQTPVYIVPNIINHRFIGAQKQNIIISAGRLDYEKGYDLLIEAARRIQDDLRQIRYQIHIYGEGKEKAALINMIEQYNLNDIIKLFPATKDLDKKLSRSKITVVPSRNEGFGMVILEAMAQHNIVISFKDTLGPSYIINAGTNGYLADYGDAGSLAKYIDIATQYYTKLTPMIEAGQQTLKQYTADHVYAAFMAIFKG